MVSDVSGNDLELQELGKGTREEGFRDSEDEQMEETVITSYDYTSNLKDIQNDLRFNSACLLALILLIGLLKGFKKL